VPQEKLWRKSGPDAFQTGESVPVSGVWRPEHDECTNAPTLWLRKQTSFPYCPRCAQATTFILLEEVRHISEDPDFTE
jgi:hypothetical protein